MDINLVFKIAATGIIVAVLNQLLIRSWRADPAMITTPAALVGVLSTLVPQISNPIRLIKDSLDPRPMTLLCQPAGPRDEG